MESLHVLRVTAEGPVTSFRYPHFVQGVHPTFDLPPPSTIYGHICSAWGGWIQDISPLRFGYTFTHLGAFKDLEHLHFGGGIDPFTRHLLFEPRLTLYLSSPDLTELHETFLTPYYPVALGRSQDLMTYTSVGIIELVPASQAYFEGTLLPLDFAPYVDGNTIGVTMARYVDPQRVPTWARYAMLRGRARFPTQADIIPAGAPEWVWVDPEMRDYGAYPDLCRAVYFHSFVEGEE